MASPATTTSHGAAVAARMLALVFAFAGAAVAGDLAPPPGPVAPTMKPLDALEPRVNANTLPGDATSLHVISAPGSYYLTGNIGGEAGKCGVLISAANVTLDLNGFELAGVPGSLDGVLATAEDGNIAVHNGSARGWGNMGFNFFGARSCAVRDLRSIDNAGAGIAVGNASRVSDCTARGNTFGILGGEGSVYARCVAEFNFQNGFYSLEGSVWENCSALGNTGSGYYPDGEGCSLTRCAAHGNSLHGIAAIYAITIADCAATRNQKSGVYAGATAIIRGCMFAYNSEHGIFALSRLTAESCRFEGNELSGVFAQADASVRRCDAVDNGGDGVTVGVRCVVEDSLCARNGQAVGGAGVRATGEGCRIEHNTVTENGRGIVTEAAGCTVTRTDARANPPGAAQGAMNFALAPGTTFGPIVNASAGGDLGAIPASGHPLANLSR